VAGQVGESGIGGEQGEAPGGAALDRPRRDPENLRDLPLAEVGQEAEHENGPLLGTEPLEGGSQGLCHRGELLARQLTSTR
jgi:hypothetical protein